MRIYPAVHYVMGGLWVDYNLSTTVPGLYALGECNFSDHGANRLGASALMQGLADGYFVLPYTIGDYLAEIGPGAVDTSPHQFKEAEDKIKSQVNTLLSINGSRTVDEIHRELGQTMWDYVGMARSTDGLRPAIDKIGALKEEFWKDVKVAGENEELNESLEKAGRVADFIELGQLMAEDALHREESCGGHFRVEHQTDENEAKRDDENYAYAAAWQYTGDNNPEELSLIHI